MLKKRLVGVVTVKDGFAVQSYGYNRYLPLGKPECLVENLDRWGADEILVQVIDRSAKDLGPDFELLKRIGELGLETPLIYAGGIRSISDGLRSIQLGADRIVIDQLLFDKIHTVKELSERLGAQAIITSLPLSFKNNALMHLNYKTQQSIPISNVVLDLIQLDAISEVFVVDWIHEGLPASFDSRIVDNLPLKRASIIAFGGISDVDQMKLLLQNSKISAVAVGNFLSYREHAIQKYKAELSDMPLRHAHYKSQFLLNETNV